MTEKLDTDHKLFDCACKMAKEHFEKSGEILPMFMFIDDEDHMTMALAPWGSENEKRLILAGLRATMLAKRVQRYAFMCEVWIAKIDKDIADYDGPPPSERADREEKLMVLVSNPQARPLMKSYSIERPTGGKPRLAEEKEPGGMDMFSGRLVELLKTGSVQ